MTTLHGIIYLISMLLIQAASRSASAFCRSTVYRVVNPARCARSRHLSSTTLRADQVLFRGRNQGTTVLPTHCVPRRFFGRNLSARALSADETVTPAAPISATRTPKEQYREKIVLWRGEGTAGYSLQFRHLELSNAIAAVHELDSAPELHFNGMLEYDGKRQLSERELGLFGGATEFVCTDDGIPVSADWIVNATRRCSLIRECYEVIAMADTYEELAAAALESGVLKDVLKGGMNEDATWRVRLRQYGSTSTNDKGRRYGKNVRSPLRAEKRAIQSMAALFSQFAGRVRLKDPDCSLFLFEGTKEGNIVLARLIAKGPKTSAIAPRTRICITNTPLEPVAAYNLCNLARIRDGDRVLDTYAGSCATLLAASSLAPNCITVGIEIALKKFVKKEDIVEDFTSRGLQVPSAIICGDCMSRKIRDKARKAVGDEPFDAIVTDPPYGIREKAGDDAEPPLIQLFTVIADDREAGNPLLRVGGRLAAFVPVAPGQDLHSSLPDGELMKRAGMELTDMRDQPLNEKLTRWLVAFTCTQ
mmetsp:Transcript_1780/g.4208  ORF Transcript_1780/g.4208 Transcript_1780/m.4208 type:complete len:534 (-) Transcript_1780:1640-3241(-)